MRPSGTNLTIGAINGLAIGGADVMQVLGTSAGPVVGQVLRALLERVIEDPSLNERERLLALVPTVVG